MESPIVCLRLPLLSILITAAVLLGGCGGSPRITVETTPGLTARESAPATAVWPVALPVDAVQPWEEVDASGYVIPGGRTASGINADTEFKAGHDRFNEAGDVSDLGEASRLASGTPGTQAISWVQYRLELGGEQPGVISADVNPRPRDGAPSEYWLGVGNYATGAWNWHGPFTDSHVRLGLSAADYLTPLGNAYVCVVAYDGAQVDIVGIGANRVDAGDHDALPMPTGLNATPVAGGLELNWNDVIAGDLAGYRVYYSRTFFFDELAAGVEQLPHLEGGTRCILSGIQYEQWVRVAAVDVSGNVSAPSAPIHATPLSGNAPNVQLLTEIVSGELNVDVTLVASGADYYDWDLDGDGIFEDTFVPTATALADTSQSGIIRPAVRGMNSDGTAVAGAGVSLIVGGNQRPVASAVADPSCGPAPLEVTFTGTGDDPDGEIALYAWDFDGNSIYEWDSESTGNPPPVTYNLPFLRNVKFRVEDDLGAYDVDTVSVLIEESDVWYTTTIDGALPISGDRLALCTVDDRLFCAYQTMDGMISIIRSRDTEGRNWNFPRRLWIGYQPSIQEINGIPAVAFYDSAGPDCMFSRADDASGDLWTGPVTNVTTGGIAGYGPCLRVVNGRPAVACRDLTGDVIYIRASDSDGAAWPAGNIYVGPGGADSSGVSLAVINGNPAVAWSNNAADISLMYARANDVNGSVFLPPATVDDSTPSTGIFPSLAQVNGRPAIAYSNVDNIEVRYVRAQDTTGTAWGTPVRVNPPGMKAFYGSLAVIDGIPVIAFLNTDSDDLMISRADDANGTNWGTPELIKAEENVGRRACLISHHDRPAIVYFNLTWQSVEYAFQTRDY